MPLTEEVVPEPEPIREVPVEIVAVPEPAIVLPPMVAEEPQAIVEPPRQGAALRAAWVLSFAVLVAAVWFAYSAKESVMQAWPPSVRVYAALGLASAR